LSPKAKVRGTSLPRARWNSSRRYEKLKRPNNPREETNMTENSKSDAGADGGVIDKAADVSVDVLQSVEDAQRAALAAVRKFLETVDEAIPGDPARREAVVGGAMGMADNLVTAQYEFLRSVVRTAGGTASPDKTA
jgi:hypothetical protein